MKENEYLKQRARKAFLDKIHEACEIVSWAENHPFVTEAEAKDLQKAEALLNRIFERVEEGDET